MDFRRKINNNTGTSMYYLTKRILFHNSDRRGPVHFAPADNLNVISTNFKYLFENEQIPQSSYCSKCNPHTKAYMALQTLIFVAGFITKKKL
jgi:NADH:ubiquinone oxidoreductase subunit H